jgi:hypothetical protein
MSPGPVEQAGKIATSRLSRTRPTRFRKGQRVRPSEAGKRGLIFPRTRWDQSGVVLKVDEFNAPTVLWAGRKTPKGYHPDFIRPDYRRRS